MLNASLRRDTVHTTTAVFFVGCGLEEVLRTSGMTPQGWPRGHGAAPEGGCDSHRQEVSLKASEMFPQKKTNSPSGVILVLSF